VSIIISKIVGTTFLKLSEGESINTITYEEKGSATVKEKHDRNRAESEKLKNTIRRERNKPLSM